MTDEAVAQVDQIRELAVQEDIDLTGMSYADVMAATAKHLRHEPEFLPVACDWTDPGYPAIAGSTDFSQSHIRKFGDTYYIYHEYHTGTKDGTRGNSWGIGIQWATSLEGPWTMVENVLPISNTPGAPDYWFTADPTVLYIPWGKHKYHMWFDMLATYTSFVTSTNGHAWADDPLGPWTRQATNGITDIVQGAYSSDFGGYAHNAHCPEAYIVGGVVHCLYGSTGAGHNGIDTMLAIANDSAGIGYSFEVWGPVTTDLSTNAGTAYRFSSPIEYNGLLYSIVSSLPITQNTWMVSADHGRSWQQVGVAPHPYHSFLLEGRKLWAVDHFGKAYYMDFDNLTGNAQYASIPSATKTNLPVVSNVYKGHYIQGDTGLDRYAEGVLHTEGGLIADKGISVGQTDQSTASMVLHPAIGADKLVDTFDRANGAIGGSWSGATWTIAGNRAVNTPTLGATLITNGGFFSGTLVGWGAYGAGVLNAYVDGGKDGGHLNTANGGAQYGLARAVATSVVGRYYLISFYHKNDPGTGKVFIGSAAGTSDLYISEAFSDATWTLHKIVVRATTTTLSLMVSAGTQVLGDATSWDTLAIQEIAPASMFCTQEVTGTVAKAQVGMWVTADPVNVTGRAVSRAGMVLKLDSASDPQNYIKAFRDGVGIRLDKVVGGVLTNLIYVPIDYVHVDYVPGALIEVRIDGTSYTLYYNGEQQGTAQTISDAGIVSNTLYGLYSDDTACMLDNFAVTGFKASILNIAKIAGATDIAGIAVDGVPGVSGTFANPTSITVVDGIITAIS